MKPSRNKIISLVLAAVFTVSMSSATVAAKTGSGQVHGAAASKTLNFLCMEGVDPWINTLDPSQVEDTQSSCFIAWVNQGLVKLLPNGTVSGALAKSWKLSSNHLTWTFTLRKNLHFYNGDKVTAYDFLFSMARAALPAMKSPVTAYYDNYIVGVTKVASGSSSETMAQAMKTLSKGIAYNNKKRTVAITTTKPTPFFLEALTYPTSDVVDPKVVPDPQSASDNNTFITDDCDGADATATGPFVYYCSGSGEDPSHKNFYSGNPSITVIPNPHYYGNVPKINIYNQQISSVETGYTDYTAGNLDVTGIPTADVPKDKKSPPKSGSTPSLFVHNSSSAVEYITPNEAKGYPLHAKTCRLALAYGLNRDKIVKVLHGTVNPLYTVLPPNIPGYYNGKNNPHYNVKKARTNLQKCVQTLPSKDKGELTLSVDYADTGRDIENEFAAITNSWNSLNTKAHKWIKASATGVTTENYFNIIGQNLNKTKTAITDTGWQEDFPDGYDYCTLLLRSGENYDIGNFNSKTYNKLVDDAASHFKQSRRVSDYIKAQHVALSNGAWITVDNGQGFALQKKTVKGLVYTAAYFTPQAKGENWSKVTVG
jgi:oligopeptide transport system substrate-binding protein